MKVVLIDDDLTIRYSLKALLSKLSKKYEGRLDIFSSGNGVEGLGYVYVTNPEIIIVDTTLPKYSGKEVVEFLISHNMHGAKEIVVLHERDSKITFPEHFKLFDKSDKDFTDKLYDHLEKKLFGIGYEDGINTLHRFLLSSTVNAANSSDLLMRKIKNTKNKLYSLFLYVFWLIKQVQQSLLLTLLFTLVGKVEDSNIDQRRIDKQNLRIIVYPSLVTAFSAIVFFLLQVGIFVAGGVVILNTRMESIFAMAQGEKGYEFTLSNANDYIYDGNEIEFTNDGVRLKGTTVEIEVPDEGLPEEEPEEEIPLPEVTPTPTPEITPEPTPIVEEVPSPEPLETGEPIPAPEPPPPATPEDVLGIEDENLSATTSVTTYPATKPSITTKEPVSYNELTAIEQRGSTTSSSEITYQLSPDGENWYYLNENENRWSKTTQEWVSSNTLEEINESLSLYEESFGSGELFLKIFLNSDGNTTPTLKEVVVERDLSMATEIDNTLPLEPVMEEIIVGDMNFNVLEVEIFNAAYFNGNKVVRGKVLLSDKSVKAKYEVSQEQLDLYEARIYYSSAGSPTKESLIGITPLYLNDRGEIEFTLREPSRAGGYVTAEVVLKPTETEESGIVPELIGSPLAIPVLNSTFTIDSTGDAADASTDGLCATAGAVCTLRAAIAEASATGGPHSISFNIPTSDGGYVDFDGGVGDSNGDDYWVIAPATALPTITSSGVTIDGATQTTNQGNFNTSGPEIVIDGHTAGEIRGLYFTGTNGTVNSITIHRFGSTSAAIEVTGDGFNITNSYVGPFAKGTTAPTGSDRSLYGVYMNVASGTIGTSTSDGNIITSNINYGVYASCGTGASGETVNIAGNKIGLGADGTTPLGNETAGVYLFNDCISKVGGDTSAGRNYIAGTNSAVTGGYGIYLNLSNNAIPNVQVYNNFVGTGTDGVTSAGNRISGIQIQSAGSHYSGAQNPIRIGDDGKPNLVRYSLTGRSIRMETARSVYIVGNTLGEAAVSGNISLGSPSQPILYDPTGLTFDVDIKNNWMCRNVTDPHFGVTTGAGTATLGTGVIDGLEMVGNTFCGADLDCGPSLSNPSATITDNVFSDYVAGGGCPHRWRWAANITFERNQVISNNNWGIQIQSLFHGTIQDNIFTDNTNEALRLSATSPDSTGMKWRNNRMYNNNLGSGMQISSALNDITVNDAGDVDAGNNEGMNWGVVNGAQYLGAGIYRVSGRLDGKVSEAPFTIEICQSSSSTISPIDWGNCYDPLEETITELTPDEISGASNFYDFTVDVSVDTSNGITPVRFVALATNNLNSTSGIGANFTCTDDTVCPNAVFDVLNLIDPIDGEEIEDTTPLLDWDPSQMSDGTLNPEVDHYDVLIDGVVVGTVNGSITQFQTTTSISSGNHTWKVIAYRTGNVITGQSSEETFSVSVPSSPPTPIVYTFNNASPIGEIEDTTPLFDWSDISEESNATHYDLYVDGILLAERLPLGTATSEYQITEESSLAEGEHTWYVIAYYLDEDEEKVEVARSTSSVFTIVIVPVETPPIPEEEEPEVIPPITGKESPVAQAIKEVVPYLPQAAPLVAVSLITGALATATGLGNGLGIFAQRTGVFFGILIPKKKKYWGIIFDEVESKGIPFAVIRLVKEGNVKHTAVTDLEGRYGILVGETGEYDLEVKADGFKEHSENISIKDVEQEIIKDINLDRTDLKVNFVNRIRFYTKRQILVLFNIVWTLSVFVGLIISLRATISSPNLVNIIIIMLYIAFFVTSLVILARLRYKKMGSVKDSLTGLGVPNASVRFYENGRQVLVWLTNGNGELKVNMKKGKYHVLATKDGYTQTENKEIQITSAGYMDQDIQMSKGAKTAANEGNSPFGSTQHKNN